MLKMQNIGKAYRKNSEIITVLSRLNVTVPPGEFTAIRGASGSGKTTLLLIAGGLLHPDEGQVVLAGQNMFDLSAARRAEWRARHVGFVFQQYHLLPYLTVLENILLPRLSQPEEQYRLRAMALMDELGLAQRHTHLPAELSAGEKQRTALARALVHEPALVLADEITGNLDRDNARSVVLCLKKYAAAGGTVLLVTHDEEAAGQADRTITLKR